jgi:hypothetical protein
MTKLSVRCTDWRPLRKNTLLGFARVQIAELDLTIHDVALHRSHGRLWAQLPSRPWVKDGQVVLGEDGKIQYSPLLEFGRREVRDAFSAAVIRAIEERFPDAFAETEPAS